MQGTSDGKLRILLVAEACNPAWASVPLVGYNVARALAARPDLQVSVVTYVRNQAVLEGDPLAFSASLHFVSTELIAGPLYRLGKLLRGGKTLSWTTNTAVELVPSLRAAMEQLAGDPVRCRMLAQNACRKVRQEFTWAAKATRIVEIYHEVLGREPCPTIEPSATLASMF